MKYGRVSIISKTKLWNPHTLGFMETQRGCPPIGKKLWTYLQTSIKRTMIGRILFDVEMGYMAEFKSADRAMIL